MGDQSYEALEVHVRALLRRVGDLERREENRAATVEALLWKALFGVCAFIAASGFALFQVFAGG